MCANIMHWRVLSLTVITSFEYLATFQDESNITRIHKAFLFSPNITGKGMCKEEIPKRGPLTDFKITRTKWFTMSDLYYYTIGLTHVPLGLGCDKFGVRNFVIASSLVNTLLSSTYPFVLRMSSVLFIIHRILQAVVETIVEVATIHIVSHWALKEESTILLAICYTGFVLGSMYSDLLMGSLLLLNWTIMFYVMAGSSFIGLILNLFFLHNNPLESPFTTEEEKSKSFDEMGDEYPERIPWKKILADSSVWAIVTGQFGTSLVKHIGFMYVYLFLAVVIGVDLFDYFYAMVFCHLFAIAVPIFWSCLAQYCINKKMMPALYVRTFSAIIGNSVPFIFIILSTITGCVGESILICHAIGTAFREMAMIGTKGNILDITRYYCGLIEGIAHGAARCIVGLIVPKMLALMRLQTVEDFQMIIFAFGSISTFVTILYYVWANGVRAQWDTVETEVDIIQLRLQRNQNRKSRKNTSRKSNFFQSGLNQRT